MGSSKDRRRSGQRRAEKVKNRRRRLAEEETARERHAKLVNERAGDPRYVQKESWPGGRTLSFHPESRAGAELGDALQRQFARFRAKFGRDPQGDDPIFFDPDADVPTPMRVGDLHAALDELIEDADEIGIDPALLKAWRELDYVVTEENQHLFSAAEVQAWTDAVARHREDDDADEPDAADLIAMLADQLQGVVAHTLRDHSAEPARLFAARVMDADLEFAGSPDFDESEGAPGLSFGFAVLAAWTTGAREELNQPDLAPVVLNWISSNLGEQCANLASRAAGILGATDNADVTVDQLADDLGSDFLPALIWLSAGVVAAHGNDDPAWLRRYDPLPDDDL